MGSNSNYLAFYLMRYRKDSEIDTELTIELPCIVVAGNGARVCHHVDWTWSSQKTLWRLQLERKLSFRGPLTSKISVYSYNALSVNCEHDWKGFCHHTLTAPQKSHLSTVDDLGLLFDLQALFWWKIFVYKVHMNLQAVCQSGVIFCMDNIWALANVWVGQDWPT